MTQTEGWHRYTVVINGQRVPAKWFLSEIKYWYVLLIFFSLTLKAPITTAADDIFIIIIIIIIIFRVNKSWHFMWIVCQADNSHEMSRLVFSQKKKKKKIFFLECCLLQILLGALRVNVYTGTSYLYVVGIEFSVGIQTGKPEQWAKQCTPRSDATESGICWGLFYLPLIQQCFRHINR